MGVVRKLRYHKDWGRRNCIGVLKMEPVVWVRPLVVNRGAVNAESCVKPIAV